MNYYQNNQNKLNYQNYQVEINTNEKTSLNIKFTNLSNRNVFQKIIKPSDLTDLTIIKFAKLLENAIKNFQGYSLVLEESDFQLGIFLLFESDLLDITQNIFLDKTNLTKSNNLSGLKISTQKNQFDESKSDYILQLENRIVVLENKIKEKDLITIAKIFNLQTYNFNFYALSDYYIRYPSNTESINIILPEDTYDDVTDKRNTFSIEWNESIDPIEHFKNLKKLTINNFSYLKYFCSTYGSECIIYYNNFIEEIIVQGEFKFEFDNLSCAMSCFDYISRGNEYKSMTHSMGKSGIDHCNNKDIHNSEPNNFIFSFPKIKSLYFTKINCYQYNTLNEIDFVLKFINGCSSLNKIVLNKIYFKSYLGDKLNKGKQSLHDLKKYCQEKKIKLEICEIIYE
jgi:hypothetical protein